MIKLCPCGSLRDFSDCCGLYLSHSQTPPTAEALMRSRYTAYSMANIDYIKKTMKGKALLGFNAEDACHWASNVTWIGLKVLNASYASPQQAYVEFIATLIERDQLNYIHENSEFIYEQGVWYYIDRITATAKTRLPQKIGRNALCPCDSQKKFKNCHGQGIAW